MTPVKLAYLVSHPIQYQAPLLRRLAELPWLDLTVFFESDFSLHGYHDPGFGRTVSWDVPLTEGYDHRFLARVEDPDAELDAAGFVADLREDGFEALWLHGYARPFNMRVLQRARPQGLKVLLRDEATEISLERGFVKRLLKRLYFAYLDRRVDAYLAIGSLNRAYYRSQGIAAEKIFDVPYCVDNDQFRELAEAAAPHREILRDGLGLEPGRLVILYASKLMGRKCPDDLLEAFLGLPEGEAAPYLLFVGEGELEARLKARVAEAPPSAQARVRFLGFKGQRELPAYLDLADVLALPSLREPWGLIVNEAMCAGAAILVSDRVGATPDLVRDGGNGRVVPAGDVAALRAALAELVFDPERLAQMGTRSREIIAGWSYDQDIDGLKAALSALYPGRL